MTEERKPKLKPLDEKGRRMLLPERFGDALERACPTEELKPCPFCGSDAAIKPVYDFDGVVRQRIAACGVCYASVMPSDDQEKLIAAWNRRSE